MIRQECVTSPAAAAARMREEDESGKFQPVPLDARRRKESCGCGWRRTPACSSRQRGIGAEKMDRTLLVNDTTSLKTILSPVHALKLPQDTAPTECY
jgi:hypothetical protein